MYKVYLISTDDDGHRKYKIGYTRRDVEKRVKEFQTGNSSQFEIVSVFKSKWGSKIEAILKRKFKDIKINGEWFYRTDKDVLNFNNSCQEIHDNFDILNNNNTWLLEKGGFK